MVSGFSLKERTRLKSFLEGLFKKQGLALAGLRIIFCSDEFLLEINKTYLGHDFYTDVITFGLSGSAEPLDAEIYISIDRIRDNALDFGISFAQELHRVIFHGCLHLCGYKDKTRQQTLLMRQIEEKQLHLYFPSR